MENRRMVNGTLLGVLFFSMAMGCAFEDQTSTSVTGQREAVAGENALQIQVMGNVRHPDGVNFVPGAHVFVVRTVGEETEIMDETVAEGDYAEFVLHVPELGRYTVLAGYESADGDLMGTGDISVNGDGNSMNIALHPVPAEAPQVTVSEDGSYETAHQALGRCWYTMRWWHFAYRCCEVPGYPYVDCNPVWVN